MRFNDFQVNFAVDWCFLDVLYDTLDLPVAWRCQGETCGTILSAVAAIGEDGSVAMAGSLKEKSSDFSAVKLDTDGILLWEWQVTNKS